MPRLTPEQIAEFQANAEADNAEQLPAVVAACEALVAEMQSTIDLAAGIIRTDDTYTNNVRDVTTHHLHGMISTLTANVIEPYKARQAANNGE